MPASKIPTQSPVAGLVTVNFTVIDSPELYDAFVAPTVLEILRAADVTGTVGLGA